MTTKEKKIKEKKGEKKKKKHEHKGLRWTSIEPTSVAAGTVDACAPSCSDCWRVAVD
jgi:hypothetical protein